MVFGSSPPVHIPTGVDLGGATEFPLTQALLAQRLGVRRASVAEVGRSLHDAGLIHHERGRISIRNRVGLEAAACPCYRIIKAEFDRLVA